MGKIKKKRKEKKGREKRKGYESQVIFAILPKPKVMRLVCYLFKQRMRQ